MGYKWKLFGIWILVLIIINIIFQTAGATYGYRNLVTGEDVPINTLGIISGVSNSILTVIILVLLIQHIRKGM